MFEELHNVKEIARMLSIQRGDQLAAVHVFKRNNWNLHLR